MTSFINSWFSSNKETETPTQSVPTNGFNTSNFGPGVENYENTYPQSGMNSNMNRDGTQHPPSNYYPSGNSKEGGTPSRPYGYPPVSRPIQNVYPEIQPHLTAAARHPVSQPQPESDPWNWSLDGTQENVVQQASHAVPNRNYFTPHSDTQRTQQPTMNNNRFNSPPLQAKPIVGVSQGYASPSMQPDLHRPAVNYNEQPRTDYYNPPLSNYSMSSAQLPAAIGTSKDQTRQEAYSPANYYNQDYVSGPSSQQSYEVHQQSVHGIPQGNISVGPDIQPMGAVPFTPPSIEKTQPNAVTYDEGWNSAWSDSPSNYSSAAQTRQADVIQREVDQPSHYDNHQAHEKSPPFEAQSYKNNPHIWGQPVTENSLQQNVSVQQNKLNPNAPCYYPKEEAQVFEQNAWGHSEYPPTQNINNVKLENLPSGNAHQPGIQSNVPFQREMQGAEQQGWGYPGYQAQPAVKVIQKEIDPVQPPIYNQKKEESPRRENTEGESQNVKQEPLGYSPDNSPRPNVNVIQKEVDFDLPNSNDLAGENVLHSQKIAHEILQSSAQPVQQDVQGNFKNDSQDATTDSFPIQTQNYEQQSWGYSEHQIQQNINVIQTEVDPNSHSTLDSVPHHYDMQSWGYPPTSIQQNVNVIQTEVIRQEITSTDGAPSHTLLQEDDSHDFGSVVSASSIMYGNDDVFNRLAENDNFAYLNSGTTGNKGLAAQWSTESLHSQSSGDLREDENLQHSLSTVNSICDQVDDLHLTSTTSNEAIRPDLMAASETLSSSSSGVNMGRRYNALGARQDAVFEQRMPYGLPLQPAESDNLETLPENQERPNSIGEQSSAHRIPVGQESPRQWSSNFPTNPDNQEVTTRCNPDRNQYLETGQLSDGVPAENPWPEMERMVPGRNEGEQERSQRMVPGGSQDITNTVPRGAVDDKPPPGLRRMVPGESSSPESRGLVTQQSGARLVNGDGQEEAEDTFSQPPLAAGLESLSRSKIDVNSSAPPLAVSTAERSETIGSDTVDTFVQPVAPPSLRDPSRRDNPKKNREDRRHKDEESTGDDRPRREKSDRDRHKPSRKISRHEREDSESRRSQESVRNADRRRRHRDADTTASEVDSDHKRRDRYERDRYKKENSRSPESRAYREDRRGPRRPYVAKDRPRDDRDYYSSKDRTRDDYNKSRRSEHRDTTSEYSDYERRDFEHSRQHYRREPDRRDGKSKYRSDRDPRYANSYRGDDDWRYSNQRQPQYYERYDYNVHHRPESRGPNADQRMYFQFMTEEELMSKLAYYAAAPISNESVDYFNAVRGLPWSTKAHHNWFYYKFTPWLKMQETTNSYRDDGRGSVHSGRSSENKHYQDISGALTSSTPQRLTPTLYSTAHIRGIISGQGHMIKVAPNYPLDGQPATVHITSMQGQCVSKAGKDELKTFPGPLVRGKTHKQTLISYCNQKIIKLQQKDLDDDHILIWQLLILLIKQNGMVVGTDISELLLGNEQATAISAHQSVSPTPSNSESRRSSESASEAVQYSNVAKFNVKSDEELTKTFRNFLLYGNDNEALEWAMSNSLWGHAFFLGSKMDNRTNAKVMARFANGLPYNDPLQTFYQLKSGRQPAAVTGCVDEKWGSWRPHLAMMMANSGSSELDYKSLMTLGDSLGSRGSLYASHFIYIMAQVEFMAYSQRTSAKLVLIGSAHSKSFEEFATNEAIQLTEIYEYASKLRDGNEKFCIPSFQWYKYMYAQRLVESNFQLEALLYLEQIAKHIENQPDLYDVSFLKQVYDLGDRLKYIDPLYKDSVGQQEELSWLMLLDEIVRAKANVNQMGGFQQVYPSQPYRQESFDSNYNHPTNERPNSYPNNGYADQSEPPSMTYAPSEAEVGYDNTRSEIPTSEPYTTSMPPVSRSNDEQQYQYQEQRTVTDSHMPPPTSVSESSTTVPSYSDQQWQPNQQWQPQEQTETSGGYEHQPNAPLPAQPQEQNQMYNPSSHQMYQNQWNDVDNSRADNEEEVPQPQISLPNAYSHREEKTSESNGNPSQSSDGNAKTKKPSDAKSKNSPGWFGGIFHKLSLKPKNQMILPEDKNPTIVWDPVKKRWIDTEADGDEVTGSFAPPPKASEMAGFNAMGANRNTVGANAMEPPNANPNPNVNLQSGMPVSQVPVSNMPPPATASNGYKPNRKGKNFRSNYVDIFKGTGSLTPTPATPPGLFAMTPQSNVKIFTPYASGGSNVPLNDAPDAYDSLGQGDTQQMSRWSSASSLSREVQSYTMRGQRHFTAKATQPSAGNPQTYVPPTYAQQNTTLSFNRT